MEKIGWKIITNYKNKMYSFGLGFFVGYRDVDDVIFKRYIKLLIKYETNKIIKGKPWIALFKTKEFAEEFISPFLFNSMSFSFIKVKYIPFEGIVPFLDSAAYYNLILNYKKTPKKKKEYEIFLMDMHYKYYGDTDLDLNCYPNGTVFASKIRIINDGD